MSWPDENLPPEILAKLNKKIEEFESVTTELKGAEGAFIVQNLCIDLYMIWKSSEDPRTREELLKKGSSWDTEEPNLAHIQKYINRLMAGKLQDASDYFENALQHTESIVKEGVRQDRTQNAKNNAQKRHGENNQIKKSALDFYKTNKNSYKTKKAAARDLEDRFPPLSFHTYLNALKKI